MQNEQVCHYEQKRRIPAFVKRTRQIIKEEIFRFARKNSFITVFLVMMTVFSQPVLAISQKEYLRTRDSLQQLVESTRGEERARALYHLTRHILPYEPDKCDALIDEQFSLAEQLNNEIDLAYAYSSKGYYHFYHNNLPEAIESFHQAILIYEKNNMIKEAGLMNMHIGMIFFSSGQYEKTKEYTELVIEQLKQCNCNTELALSYVMMGFLYNNFIVNPSLSKHYHKLALDLAQKTGMDSIYKAGFYVSMALAYSNNREYDSSLYYIRKSNSFLKGESDDVITHRAIIFSDLGKTFLKMNMPDSAIYYYKLSIREADKVSYLFTKPRCAVNIATILTKEKKYEDALGYLKYALEISKRVNQTGNFYNDPEKKYAPDWLLDSEPGFIKGWTESTRRFWAKGQITNIYWNLAKYYRTVGQPDMALEYYRLYHAYYDSVQQIKNANELVNTTLKLQELDRAMKMEQLAQENQYRELRNRQNRIILISLVVVLILIVLVGIVFFRQNILKTDRQNLLLKQRLFRSQMNPHFIFNSLASIQNTIISNNPEKATRYLARFSKLVRNILDSSVAELIPLEEEISTIENYLELQKFRFPDKFDFNIEIDPELDTDSLLIPAMLVQPFIENSIEHGMKHKEGKGNIRVRFKKKDDLLVIEVEDDGIGREKAQELLMEQEKDHKSLSTGIILERLKVLNRKRKRKITIEITDLVDSNGNPLGTLVRTTIPV